MNCGGGQRDFGKKALFRMMTAKETRLNADCCKTTCLPFEESKSFLVNIHQHPSTLLLFLHRQILSVTLYLFASHHINPMVLGGFAKHIGVAVARCLPFVFHCDTR